MTAKSQSAFGFTAATFGSPAGRRAAVLTGAAAAATLLLAAPVLARVPDSHARHPIAIATVTGTAPTLSGKLVLEQHSRRGGGGAGGGNGGGAGQVVPRGGSAGGGGGGTRSGGESGGGTTSGGSGGGARTRSGTGDNAGGDAGRTRARSGSGGEPESGDVPTYSRPRGDRPATGTAVERRRGDGAPVIVDGRYGSGFYGGLYPWGWGGLGLGGYYGYYDPWGWYAPYSPPAYGYGGGYDGALRLKVKPRQAEVLVDGYFAGTVDDYDGVFQRLHLEPGPHRIEVHLDGYEPLTFEVRIQPDRTITYKGALARRD